MEQLLKDYKGDLRIVYKHFVVHPQSATEPALAACAAGKQGRWHVMSKLIWAKAYAVRDFSRSNLETLARQAKLNLKRFKNDRDGDCKDLIRLDQKEVSQVGVTGTPAFFINGRFLSGARPIDQFKNLIDEELAKAKKRIREDKSLTRANYYDNEVLGKGLTRL